MVGRRLTRRWPLWSQQCRLNDSYVDTRQSRESKRPGRSGRSLRQILTDDAASTVCSRRRDITRAPYNTHELPILSHHTATSFEVVSLPSFRDGMSRAVEPSHPLRLSAAAPRFPLGAGVSYVTTTRNATTRRCGRCGSHAPHNRTVRPTGACHLSSSRRRGGPIPARDITVRESRSAHQRGGR